MCGRPHGGGAHHLVFFLLYWWTYYFQRWMSWLAQRWRTQWNAKRNVNCRIQGIIRFLNANGAVGIFLAARLFQCLWYINIFLEPYLNACVCDYQEEDLYTDSSLVGRNALYRVVALHALMVIALAVQIYVDVSGDFSRVVWRWWVQPDLFVCVAHSRMCRGHCFVVLYFLSSLSATYIYTVCISLHANICMEMMVERRACSHERLVLFWYTRRLHSDRGTFEIRWY